MQNEQAAQLDVFDAFFQPVLLIESGVIAYANCAAERFGACAGETAARYLTQTDGALQLCFGEKRLAAQKRSYAGGELYIGEDAAGTVPAQTLSTVAQAIRAPLTNLFSVSSPLFLALEEMEDPAISRAMASLNRSFYQLLHLAGNLTDAPSALEGQITLQPEKTELCGFAYDLFERAQPLCRTCGMELVCSVPEKPFSAWIDRKRLARAVYNLLANAMKYTLRGGSISLRLLKMERFAVLEVHDTGDGMENGRLRDAFSGFTRELVPGDARWGAGLGIPLVQSIAKAHGGTFVLRTEPGSGTSAAISVSLREPPKQEQLLRTPSAQFDYTGGFRQELIELADVLPPEVYDSVNVN